jgi:UDP-N-acetylglucosamine 2-epimerase
VPNESSARQLASEGIRSGVCVVGDLMVDLAMQVAERLPSIPEVIRRFEVQPRAYAVATIHRAANTDDPQTFERIVAGLRRVEFPVIFPVHPRTREIAERVGAGKGDNMILSEPLSYREMIGLVSRAAAVFTDSGGLQKEAFVLKVPCVTLRDETEWLETLEDGWNVLAGSDPDRIACSARRLMPIRQGQPYGGGHAARNIVNAIQSYGRVRSNAAIA